MSIETRTFVNDFRNEAQQALRRVEELIIQEHDDCVLNATELHMVTRAMHLLKGGASFLDFIKINRLAHAMEDLVHLLELGTLACDKSMRAVLIRGTELLFEMVSAGDCGESVNINAILATITDCSDDSQVRFAVESKPDSVIDENADESMDEQAAQTALNDSDAIVAKKPLGQFIIDKGYLSREQIFTALIKQEQREMPYLQAFFELGMDVVDCLNTANYSRIHLLHPVYAAQKLGHLTGVSLEAVNQKLQSSRPPIGMILRELAYCDELGLRLWLQEYYDYCNDEANDPELSAHLTRLKQQAVVVGTAAAGDVGNISMVTDAKSPTISEPEGLSKTGQTTAHAPALLTALPAAICGQAIDCEDSLLSDFHEYMSEDLRTEMETLLLSFEGDTNEQSQQEENLRVLFRILHSLKGSAGFIGATASQGLIHHMEDLVNLIQKNPSAIMTNTWQAIVSACLSGIDAVWGLKAAILQYRDERVYASQQEASLLQLLAKLEHVLTRVVVDLQALVEQEDVSDLF